MYKLETKILDTHEAYITVEIEEAAFQKTLREAARNISYNVHIPGFRKGRAPFGKIMRYVGTDRLKQEAAESMIQEIYPKVIEDAGIKPYQNGTVEDMNVDDQLTFNILVPLAPEVTLGDYHSLRTDWTEPTVDDAEVADVLEHIRADNATEEVVERPCQYGDLVYIDIFGSVDDEEEGELVLIDKDSEAFLLDEDDPFLTPAFYDEIVGMAADDEKAFTITLPETLDDERLRNAEAAFDVIIHKVCAYTMPDLDDALASSVGNFETLADLKENIRHHVLERKLREQETEHQNELLETLAEQADVRYPPVLLEETLDTLTEEHAKSVQKKHKISLEDALRLEGKTLEEFRESLVGQARKRVIYSLVLSTFAAEEDITASDAEVYAAYAELIEATGKSMAVAPELDLDSDVGKTIRNEILKRKCFAHLLAIAGGEVTTEEASETIVAYEEDVEDDADEDMDAVEVDIEVEDEGEVEDEAPADEDAA